MERNKQNEEQNEQNEKKKQIKTHFTESMRWQHISDSMHGLFYHTQINQMQNDKFPMKETKKITKKKVNSSIHHKWKFGSREIKFKTTWFNSIAFHVLLKIKQK